MKILLHGLNFAPEEIGIGKYSGEMIAALAEAGHECVVVTTPPYYPHWKVAVPYRANRYKKERLENEWLAANGEKRENSRSCDSTCCDSTSAADGVSDTCHLPTVAYSSVSVIRCPIWVPSVVTGFKRIFHLASFAISSAPVVLWKAITFRPDVVMTVEPAAMGMPTSWIAARLCGAKAWLHVQDFEVDAAFELGILKQPLAKKLVLWIEGFLMRRFDRVSTISPNMMIKLVEKGVDEQRTVAFPNWVDCDAMRPVEGMGDDEPVGSCRVRASLRESFGIPVDKRVALYAGNVGAKQGLSVITDAARRLADNDQIVFVICGTGAAMGGLRSHAESLQNVVLMPPQPFERFNELMNCADVHLLPQRSDAADLVMPSKLTGMLATGRPVVACASAGTQIADIVAPHGIVVPPGDAVAFADAVVEICGDVQRRQSMGQAARRYALRHLSDTAILSQFMVDLQNLVDGDDVGRCTTNHRETSPNLSATLQRSDDAAAMTTQELSL